MKKLLICIIISGVAFAIQTDLGHLSHGGVSPFPDVPFPPTEDISVSQPFSYTTMSNALCFSGNYSMMIADDITPVDNASIGVIEFWAICTNGNLTSIHIEARDDASGPGSEILYNNDCTNITTVSIGLYEWGYPLMNIVATIDDTAKYNPVGGIKIWWILQTSGSFGPDYWLVSDQIHSEQNYFSRDNGYSWTSSTYQWGYSYNCFFILSGDSLNLDDVTWAYIKRII